MRKGIFILLMALLPAALPAQHNLSMGDAIALGLEQNFGVRIEKTTATIAANDNTWGNAGRWPTVVLTLTENNRLSSVSNPASFLNGTYTNLSLGANVDLGWTLFDGFRVKTTKEQLDKLEYYAQNNVDLVMLNTIQAIMLQYYLCLVEQERLETFRENLALSRDRLNFVRVRKEIGTAGTFDLLQVESAYLSDSTALLEQELAAAQSLRMLSRLLGDAAPGRSYRLTDSLAPRTDMFDYERLRADMEASHPNLQRALLDRELRRIDTRLAATERWPSLSVRAGVSPSTSRFQLTGEDPRGGRNLDYYVNFTLTWTLFDGGSVRRAIEDARIGEEVAALSEEQLKQEAGFDLYDALETYRMRIRLYRATAEVVRVSEDNLRLARERFEMGSINSIEFRQLQVEALNAQLSLSNAAFLLLDAETRLRAISGAIME